MSVMSSEIDCFAWTCVAIYCNGVGIILLISGYAVACAVEVIIYGHWLRGLCDYHPRLWLPPRMSALLTRRGMKSEDVAQADHSTTTQSPDRQVKLAIGPTVYPLLGTLVLSLRPVA